MTAHLDALVRELADAVKGDPDDLPVRLRKGVVFAQSPLTVKIGGSAVAVPVQATGTIPANGTVVWVLESGPRRVLLDSQRKAATEGYVHDLGTVVASTLPQSYPQGFSIGYALDSGGWPARWGTVETNRRSTDVTQTYRAVVAGENTTWKRTAHSAGNAWHPWGRVEDRADTIIAAQRSQIGGFVARTGQFRWDGSRIYWTGRLISISHGRGPHWSTDGWFGFYCPQPNAGGVIPGYGGHGGFTVDGGEGIPMGSHQALYGVPVIGGASGNTSLALVSYVADFVVPSHWVLLAVTSEADGTIMLGNGERLDQWRTPALKDGWVHYQGDANSTGDTYGPLQYRKDGGGMVHMRGLITGTNRTTDNPFILPSGYVPDRHYIFGGQSSVGFFEFRVHAGGSVNVYSTAGWVSLACTFRADR